MRRFILTIALLAALALPASGTSYYFPKFGTPVVSDSSIVFTEPGWETHRIISVDRESGAKKWEIKDPANILKVCIAPSESFENRYVITKGSEVFFCDPADGKTTLAYKVGLERCSVAAHRGSLVFIGGEKDDVDWLQLIDLKSGKKIWEVREVERISSTGDGLVICQRSKRKVNAKEKSYQRNGFRLTAIDDKDGSVKWEHGLADVQDYVSSFHVGPHLIVQYLRTVYCFDSATGRQLKTVDLYGKDDWRPVSLSRKDDRIFAWVGAADYRNGGTVCEISIPGLTKRELTATDWHAASSHVVGDVMIGQTIGRMDAYNIKTGKKVWEGGQWAWDEVRDGFIYYSEMDKGGEYAVLNRIRVETGERKLLYREPLPEKLKRN